MSTKGSLLLGFITCALAAAQSSGVLVGVITTPSGEAVRNTRIVLVDMDRGIRRQGDTDELGIFAFSLLPPGEYRIEQAGALSPVTVFLKENEKRSLRLLSNCGGSPARRRP